jgi:hypothetical protein
VDSATPTVPLGQLVLRRGLLVEERLDVALPEHMSSGERIDEHLTTGAAEDGARGIDLLRTRVAEAEAELDQPVAADPDDAGETAEPDAGYVLFVWSPSGYALLTRAGEPPPIGSEVGVSGGRLVVSKIGPSPLPSDRRRCAFLDAP